MINKIDQIIPFFILITLVSCKNNGIPQSQKIDFPKTLVLNLSDAITDSMNLSDIAYRIEYIPLETSDSSVMDNFYDYSVAEDYFFIRKELSILKFDKNGRFISSLFNVGRGPGEAFARCLAVDESSEHVYVYDQRLRDIKIYNFNGSYVRTINKPIAPPGYWIYSIGYFNNNLFIHTTQRPKVKYLYSCFDLANDSIRIICKNYREYDKSQIDKNGMAPSDYHYQITDSCILYKERFCDTIFKVNMDFTQEPRYIIDLGNRKLDWLGWRDHGMFDIAGGPPYGYQVESFSETKSYLFIVLTSFKEPTLFVVYFKNNNSIRIYKDENEDKAFRQLYLKNDLDHLMDFPPMDWNTHLYYHDGCLYSAVYAKDFYRTYQLSTEGIRNSSKYLRTIAPALKNITEFSNPVIVKVFLKQ
jgi:hypothetical protein